MRTDYAIIYSHFLQHDPKIASILPSINFADWFIDNPNRDHFFNLTRNIIYQQLAGKAAGTIFGRFESLVGEVNPEGVLSKNDQQLRDVGLSWAKVKYVKDLATKVTTGELTLDNLESLDTAQVIATLTKVKGIGVWTAEMFLLFTLHRENIFSYGDLGLKKGFTKLYGISNPTPTQLKKTVNKWKPYESYGSIALWHHLDNS